MGNLSVKVAVTIAVSAVVLALAFAGFMTLRDRQRLAQITELRNQVALRDKTIELQQGVYQKLTLQTKDLSKLLDEKDVELTALKDQLKKQGADLLTASTIIAKLKKDLESAGHVKPPEPDEGPTVRKVDFDSGADFDPFLVSGHTTVNCENPTERSAKLLLQQRSPLKFSVVVSQDKDGTWRTTASSSSDKFDVDIALAAVNPYLLEEKWYEKLSFVAEAGIGTNPGLLAGGGVDFEIGKFDVGPRVWAVLDRGASPYVGVSFAWHPFKKVR
jgi:hypothetical protein